MACGLVAAAAMLPARVSQHAREAEISATGAQLKIAVKTPPPTPVPASAGKLATMPEHLVEASSVQAAPVQAAPVQAAPVVQPRAASREGARARSEDAIIVDDPDDQDAAPPPRYARVEPRWRSPPREADDEEYDDPAPARDRYRYAREREGWDDQREYGRRFDDRYAPAPYPGERYYPPYDR